MLWDKTFPGLRRAIRTSWSLLGVKANIQSNLLFSTLPYLHPRSTPIKIESGIWCVGCHRDIAIKRGFDFIRRMNCDDLAVHVREAFPEHFSNCQTARQIKEGNFLSLIEEYRLTKVLYLKRMEYWPRGYRLPPELIRLCHRRPGDKNWTAIKFQEWYAESLRSIVELGERDQQYRTQLSDFAHYFDEKCHLSSQVSTDDATCTLTEETRNFPINLGQAQSQSLGKTEAKGYDSKLHTDKEWSDEEKSLPPVLQKHDDDLPGSLSLQTAKLANHLPKCEKRAGSGQHSPHTARKRQRVQGSKCE